MRNTAIGLFRHTASSSSYTNANHFELLGTMRRMMGVWHGVTKDDYALPQLPQGEEGFILDAISEYIWHWQSVLLANHL